MNGNFFYPQMLSLSELLPQLIVELKADQSISIHERILRGGILGEVDYRDQQWLTVSTCILGEPLRNGLGDVVAKGYR